MAEWSPWDLPGLSREDEAKLAGWAAARKVEAQQAKLARNRADRELERRGIAVEAARQFLAAHLRDERFWLREGMPPRELDPKVTDALQALRDCLADERKGRRRG